MAAQEDLVTVSVKLPRKEFEAFERICKADMRTKSGMLHKMVIELIRADVRDRL